MIFPILLRDARFNTKTGCYEVTEAGAEYTIPTSMIRSLRKFLDCTNSMIVFWYEDLPEEEKKKVHVRYRFRVYD